MDARGVLHPVGPHQPRVYWTRRLVLVGAVVLVLVLIVAFGCSGSGSGSGSGTPRPHVTSSASPSPKASATTSAAANAACAPAQLSVTAGTDRTSYPNGVLPRLEATVRTSGTAACQLTVAATWTVISGSDTVFTTAGCAPARVGPSTVMLRPNHPYRTALVWNRQRSTPNCGPPGQNAAAGTYQLRVAMAGATSGLTVFHLTG